MSHIVTCIYCKQKFDRDKHPFEQISARRFAHKECFLAEQSKQEKIESDKEKLDKYIMELFKIDYVGPRIRKQINQYINDYNFSYSGIRKALAYFYEIKGNSIEKANGGIGIVPYIYKDAYNYYFTLWQAQQVNINKDIQSYIPKEKIVTIPRPQRKLKKKRQLFTFLDEEELNEQ